MLLKAQERQDNIEHLRFLISLKSIRLDTENQGSLNEYNNLLKEYMDLIDPTIAIERDMFAKGKNTKLNISEIDKLDFSNIKLGKAISNSSTGNINFTTGDRR